MCAVPVLGEGGSGSENSPVGIGRSVFVASTYGYPYPALPEGAGPAVPPSAPFTGGMTRVDVADDGCHVVWENRVRSAAVPRLSTADGALYTVARVGLDQTTPWTGTPSPSSIQKPVWSPPPTPSPAPSSTTLCKPRR